MLLFLIPADSDNINREFDILINELRKYNPELLDKKRLLAITKSDLLDGELMEEIGKDLPPVPWLFISSITHAGIPALKDKLWEMLNS